MPSKYLQTAELVGYGVAGATADQIQQASILIDAALKRPEGLEYTVDDAGNPICMTALVANGVFSVAAGVPTGTGVTAVLSGPTQTLKKGSVLIADRTSNPNREALVVSAIAGNTVTFERVTKVHAVPTPLESGLQIKESRRVAAGRGMAMLSRSPIMQIFSMVGKYGAQRRGTFPFPHGNDYDLVGIVSQFTGGDVWDLVNVANVDFNSETGWCCLPSGLLSAPYTEIEASYIAGFRTDAIPAEVKQIAANIISVQGSTPMSGNIKLLKAGDTQIERFMSTVMGQDELRMLSQYKARVFA